jgi:hypothetical protein
MKNQKIRNMYEKFLVKYSQYIISNDDKWIENLNTVIKFIDENKYSPSSSSKQNSEIAHLGKWIDSQKRNYDKKTGAMSNENTRKLWKNLVEKYLNICLTKWEFNWYEKLSDLKKFMINNPGIRPKISSENQYVRSLGRWLCRNTYNYRIKVNVMKIYELTSRIFVMNLVFSFKYYQFYQ